MPDTTHLHWAALTHSGSRKPLNEDSIITFASGKNGAQLLPPHGHSPLTHSDLIFAISDGMGGGNAGHIASSLILHQMTKIIPETFHAAAAGLFPDSLAHLLHALRTIHLEINTTATSSAETSGMAATLALTWFTPENLYLANIGDSRIYLARNGQLQQISHDHTHAWSQWKRGEISEFQYRHHPRRAALYQVLGSGHTTFHPHLAAIPYLPGDTFLLCSDGLIDGLWERHLTNALTAPSPSPLHTAETLLKRAIDNSGIDDTSLIVISVSTQQPAASPEDENKI